MSLYENLEAGENKLKDMIEDGITNLKDSSLLQYGYLIDLDQ